MDTRKHIKEKQVVDFSKHVKQKPKESITDEVSAKEHFVSDISLSDFLDELDKNNLLDAYHADMAIYGTAFFEREGERLKRIQPGRIDLLKEVASRDGAKYIIADKKE